MKHIQKKQNNISYNIFNKRLYIYIVQNLTIFIMNAKNVFKKIIQNKLSNKNFQRLNCYDISGLMTIQ